MKLINHTLKPLAILTVLIAVVACDNATIKYPQDSNSITDIPNNPNRPDRPERPDRPDRTPPPLNMEYRDPTDYLQNYNLGDTFYHSLTADKITRNPKITLYTEDFADKSDFSRIEVSTRLLTTLDEASNALGNSYVGIFTPTTLSNSKTYNFSYSSDKVRKKLGNVYSANFKDYQTDGGFIIDKNTIERTSVYYYVFTKPYGQREVGDYYFMYCLKGLNDGSGNLEVVGYVTNQITSSGSAVGVERVGDTDGYAPYTPTGYGQPAN